MKHLIAPSVLAANFANLQQDIQMINSSVADWIHVDIMDGVFVPNISFGFPVLEAIARDAQKPLDVHLMIVDPDRYIKQFAEAGAHNITVHYEACTHLNRTIQSIKEAGCKAGVALNPHTPVSVLQDILQDVDIVLIMSVNPGFGGQKFIKRTYDKIQRLKRLASGINDSLFIEIDGGVDLGNSNQLLQAGANVLVAGNFVFSAHNPSGTIQALKAVNPEIIQA